MTERQGAGLDTFRVRAPTPNDGFGVVADVYVDRTRKLSAGREFAVVLGRVIARELGPLADRETRALGCGHHAYAMARSGPGTHQRGCDVVLAWRGEEN